MKAAAGSVTQPTQAAGVKSTSATRMKSAAETTRGVKAAQASRRMEPTADMRHPTAVKSAKSSRPKTVGPGQTNNRRKSNLNTSSHDSFPFQ
jgi:hypothetical protein